MTPKEQCEVWNAAHPCGTPAILRTDTRDIRVTTRGAAHLMGDLPVITLEGLQQRYALARVTAI